MYKNRFFGIQLPSFDDAGGGSGAGGSAGSGTGAGAGAGAGAGSGSGAGAGAGQGAGAAGAGQGGGSGAGAGGGSSHIAIASADQLVQFPGMDKPVKFSEWQRSHIPANTQTQALLKIAQAIDDQKRAGRGGKGGAGDGQQPKKPSVLDNIRNNVVVGGEDLAALVDELRSTALDPMGKAVLAILQELKGVRGRVGSLHENHATQEFQSKISSAVKALPLPQTEQAIPGVEILNDIFENTYLAYDVDANDPNKVAEMEREYPAMVKKQFDGLRGFFRELEKAELAAAEMRKRKAIFARPGGGASGNGGQAPGKPITNKDAAARLFRGEGVQA